MARDKKRKPTVRVVRSLHIPQEIDRKIVKAALQVGESVAAFIRTAAEHRADAQTANAA